MDNINDIYQKLTEKYKNLNIKLNNNEVMNELIKLTEEAIDNN